MMILDHPFRNMCDVHQLLDECYKVNTFCDRLERQAEENQSKFDIDKFKGDGLECLVEFLLKYMGNHTAINIQDYHTIDSTDDTGVDGKGISIINKRPMTIQVKYRQANHVLTANNDHLSNFMVASLVKYGVHVSDTQNMLIITTAGDTHYYTSENMLCGKVKTINRDGLRELIDNKIAIWDEFKKSMLESRTQPINAPKITLRQHQQEAVASILTAIDQQKNGKVVLPTGTGKTLIQAATIAARIKQGDKVFAVFSPRILLSFQLLKEISTYLQGEGIDAEYLNVNSGKFPEEEINDAQMQAGFAASQIESTTSPQEVSAKAMKAQGRNMPLIISSTYHSADQITASGIHIDLQLNDEAHHLVSEEFGQFTNVGARSFSFTATPKETDSDDGLGMQNPKFGEEIYKKTAREMVDTGEMLPPALHIVVADAGKHSNDRGEIFACITAAFERHIVELRRKSRLPDKIGAKLLVTLDGQATLDGILNCREFEAFRKANPNINVIAMSTDVGVYINGERHDNCDNTWKRRVFDKLRTMGDTEQAVILYVDMLGEGIDVPGITAFMPIRGMGDSKFKQGVGRACRLSAIDRRNLYDKVMKPDERGCYVKPFAYVIIPDLTIGCEDYRDRYKDLIYALCDEYGLSIEDIFVDHVVGFNDRSALENVDASGKGRRHITRAEIEQFYHEVREDIDRPLDIHELALIDMFNADLGEVGTTYLNMAEEIYNRTSPGGGKSASDWFKDDLKTYIGRAFRRKGKTYEEMIKKARKIQSGVFRDEVKVKYGTVYTPEFVIDKTLDLAFKYLPKDADPLTLTWCDPSAGDGNFLINLYHRLMKCPSALGDKLDPIARSEHILTKCIYGVEILRNMVYACKIRLVLQHLRTIQKTNFLERGYCDIMEKLNIYHGNTIMVPEDVGKWKMDEQEAGLLDEAVRSKKYDVVIGNPPYSDFRNVDVRKKIKGLYAAFPHYADAAQCFVEWAHNHAALVSFNISDTWINDKKIGNKSLQLIVGSKIVEIVQNNEIMRYSEEGSEGLVNTMVIVISEQTNSEMKLSLDNKTVIIPTSNVEFGNNLIKTNKTEIKFKAKRIIDFAKWSTYRNPQKQESDLWDKQMVFGDDTCHLAIKYVIKEKKCRGSFKLVSNINNFSSKVWKFASSTLDMPTILWLFGYLNSTNAYHQIKLHSKILQRGDFKFSIKRLQQLQVPDFDYYKTNRPEQFNAYMKWIEDNMRDKDEFLAGIDAEFEKLIKEKT